MAENSPKGTPDEKVSSLILIPPISRANIKSNNSTKYNMFGDLLNDDPAF